MKIRLSEVFNIKEALKPGQHKIEPEDVQRSEPHAWEELKRIAQHGLEIYIFDTDDSGMLWAINDQNLFWDGKGWNEFDGDEPPHWKK